jgi:hypothetical protein
VNEMALLLGLLVVAYFGGLALKPGVRVRYGLPAGSHWLVLGFVLGPHALGVVGRDALQRFDTLAVMATAWIALVLGVEYGHAGNRKLSARAVLLGAAVALLSAGTVGLAVYLCASELAGLSVDDSRVIATGLGLAGSETARHAVRWVVERGAIHGPLLTVLEEITDTDEIVPMLCLALLFAGVPSAQTLLPMSYGGWFAVTLVLGVVLGLTATLLLAGLTAEVEAWCVLMGCALLGTGIAWRLHISPLTALFVMGLCISLISRRADALRPVLMRSESAVLLPTLLLAGALLRFDGSAALWWILIVTLVVRTSVRALLGYVLSLAAGAEPRQRWRIGLGMSSTGSVSLLVGLTFAFRFSDGVGQLVLTVSACSAVLGDVLGSAGLHAALVPGAAEEPAPASAAT